MQWRQTYPAASGPHKEKLLEPTRVMFRAWNSLRVVSRAFDGRFRCQSILQNPEPAPEWYPFLEDGLQGLREEIDRVGIVLDRLEILERAPAKSFQDGQPMGGGLISIIA